MTNLEENLADAFEDLDDETKINLWNKCCEGTCVFEDKAIPVDQLEEYFPIDSFSCVQRCVQMYSGIMDDNGYYTCKYAKYNVYGYLEPFKVDDDIDVEDLVAAIADSSIEYRDLPAEMQEIIDEEDE